MIRSSWRAVSTGEPDQFNILLPPLAAVADRQAALAALRDIVRQQPPEGNDIGEEVRITLGRRRAGAAIALLQLGESPSFEDLVRPTSDPEARTQFIAGLRIRGVEAGQLLEQLDEAAKPAVRYGVLLALGEFQLDELPENRRDEIVRKLTKWYRTEPDASLHSACSWLLRHWGCADEIRKFDRTPEAANRAAKRQWFVVRTGDGTQPGFAITMLKQSAGEFDMGSPPSESDRQIQEAQHRVKLTRPFAMSQKLVSRALYLRYLETTRGQKAAQAYREEIRETSPTDEHAASGTTWFDGVGFCRWLTAQQGMGEADQCYADPATLKLDAQGHPADRQWPFHPERQGFRLPTEAEWEYACRAGTVTAFSFGSDETMADGYGWFQANSHGNLHLSAPLRPNARGLVSMHGNNSEWCHDWLAFDPGPNRVDPVGPPDGHSRTIRGGSFLNRPALARSACRAGLPPDFSAPYAGLRLVQTLPQEK